MANFERAKNIQLEFKKKELVEFKESLTKFKNLIDKNIAKIREEAPKGIDSLIKQDYNIKGNINIKGKKTSINANYSGKEILETDFYNLKSDLEMKKDCFAVKNKSTQRCSEFKLTKDQYIATLNLYENAAREQ